jgi:hypothetical protein
MKITNLFSSRKHEFLIVAVLFVSISVFFLLRLIIGSGDVAQGDWGIPLTSTSAINDFNARLFVRSYNGFGEISLGRWAFPYFPLVNAVLALFGFVGGVEIKILSVFLVALGGVTAYILARSFGLSKSSSFLCGLFFMSSAVVFDWLMFGWIYYLIGYDLFPLMILTTKKFIFTNKVRYVLINGLILSIVAAQPAFLLVYPTVGFLFVLFESKDFLNGLRKGLALTVVSLSIWFLTALSFFISYNNSETLSFYRADYFNVIQHQFVNFSQILNPIRLWGSTYNFQFETYFPKSLILLSFVPVILGMLTLLLRHRDKRVLFFFLSYMVAFLAYYVSNNLQFFVFSFPFGGIFEAPSVFLVPASIGLAMLIGYSNEALPLLTVKIRKSFSMRLSKDLFFIIILILIVLAGFPWWNGQTSGNPISGPATKLNLYSISSSFTEWSNNVTETGDYFVLYIPLDTNVQIVNSTYFSRSYEGVNMGIFNEINNLPYVSVSNSSLFLNELINDSSSTLGEEWGSFSIKYIVVYTNVVSTYNMSDILDNLSVQGGLVKVATLPDVVVFEDKSAKPVVYADNASIQIVYHDPTSFKVQANSSAPFILEFNQVYSSGWKAWVNGTALPDSAHFKDANGFNGWRIDATGSIAVSLYYEPQTAYLASTIISAATIIAILMYLVVTVLKNRHRPKDK